METKIKFEALITERDGMLAENEQRLRSGWSIAYTDEAFSELAARMLKLLEKSEG